MEKQEQEQVREQEVEEKWVGEWLEVSLVQRLQSELTAKQTVSGAGSW